ncbi:MAG: T9SS type A sorting domain-containing protein [Candidatus Cloacimonadota bacterium]|nr:T9SS type A sorting domain-containing protein [Candidatus Cloacimonadota bacterium]
MKKILMALIVGLFVVGFSSLAFAQNLVTNGDLELWTGGIPDNWDHVENITQETTNIHGGTYSAAHQSASTKDFGHEYITGIIAGHDYTLSYYYFDNDNNAKTRLWSKWKDDSGSTVGSTIESSYSTNNANWQFYTTTVTAPANATQFYLEVRVYAEDTSGGYVYYDDFSLTDEGVATPVMESAYSISNTAIDVFYNIDVTSVDPADYSLTGTAAITFSSATIDGSNAKLVHLTGASPSMTGDTTVDNIADAANSTNYDFYAGIMPIANTNTLVAGGPISNDTLATFQGIVSANDAYNSVWISDASGAYNGVLIYDWNFDALVAVGDEILFTAKRHSYFALSELINPTLLNTISSGNSPYGPSIIDGSDINETLGSNTNPGEKWEGQLVKIQNFYVDSYTNYDYVCSCGSDTFHVGDNVDYHFGVFSLIVGETYQEMTGVVDWDNSGPYYRINPRDNDDQTLPVELSSFTAEYTINQAEQGYVSVNWKTASETDVIGFNIYRNIGETYGPSNKINSDIIKGNGTTTLMHTYSFKDEEADIYTSYYYWLEVVNLGGTNDIHGPIKYKSIDIDGNGELNIISGNLNPCFPNPVQLGNEINFKFMVGGLEGNTKYVELKVYNVLGELVAEIVNEDRMVNEYTETWAPRNLSAGVYFYQLKTENFNEVKKLVIVR